MPDVSYEQQMLLKFVVAPTLEDARRIFNDNPALRDPKAVVLLGRIIDSVRSDGKSTADLETARERLRVLTGNHP